ncbi:hypothetical protein [Jiella flava]|uniref:hypothetical protein n=1 Tax=Jiella flava TaxID=2816857 RepID=UPI001E3B7975|nr:hypothetical protein [Jiella flava]
MLEKQIKEIFADHFVLRIAFEALCSSVPALDHTSRIEDDNRVFHDILDDATVGSVGDAPFVNVDAVLHRCTSAESVCSTPPCAQKSDNCNIKFSRYFLPRLKPAEPPIGTVAKGAWQNRPLPSRAARSTRRTTDELSN